MNRTDTHERIRRLDEATVARIAAGEVITRPAAAVRELIENALDAGATSVSIDLETAGLDLVRVADDGHGMSRTDAPVAVERHATSKIRDAEDLPGAPTLGFRGEALPSIAEVGRVELTTRADGDAEGTRVTVEGGETRVAPAGRAVGTTVTVRDLFADVPARREALATPRREFARVSDLVASYALTRPDVRFGLDHDGRQVLSTPGSGSYTDALLAVYGRDVAGQSVAVEAEADDAADTIQVRGRCAHPSVTRASTAHVTVAVNGRPLADSGLRRAVERGYGSLLPGDRHPLAVVCVSLPPERVDQNVHPGKREVRFRDREAVEASVERAVAAALSTEDLARSAEAALDWEAADIDAEGEGESGPTPARSRFDDLTVIGQFRGLYVLCEADDDLLVVDQHAAHERINYERLRELVDEAGAVESLSVDPPATLSLAPGPAAALDAHREAVEALGFRVESFGGGTYRVTGVPAPLGRAADPGEIRDLLDAFLAGETPEDPRDALLADVACHPSLKAGAELSREDCAALLDDLGACRQPYACPHGRPTVVSIDESTLATSFGRSETRLG
jgi:DNA mismatch repair protein MutL